MANGTGSGGSVLTTTAVSGSVGIGVVIANYLVHPLWPPPEDVITIVVAACSAPAHLIGRAIYRKLTHWAGESENGNGVAPALVAPNVLRPQQPTLPPTPAGGSPA